MTRLLISMLAVTTIFLLLPSKVTAQQTTEISVAPAILDVPVEIGGSIKKTIRITNGSDQPLPLTVDVVRVSDDSEPIDGLSADRFNVSSWVSFDNDTYVFEAGESREIEFMVTVPFSAAPGGHYASIVLRGLALESDSSAGSSLIFPEISVPLFITLPGEVKEEVLIVGHDLFPLFVKRNEIINNPVPIQNTGSIHELVSAKLIIKKNGEIIEQVVIQPSVILPSTEKEYMYQWQPARYGTYTASIEITYGNTTTVYESMPEKIFVTPPLAQLTMLAVLTWTFLYMYPRRHNIKRSIGVLFTRH